ncbi:MAG: four helix bundle protein [Clostridiales bacterium]|nr:four helix bundle protein [Clostridiales bacterium]
MHIALKECSESLYWLELLKRVNYKIKNIDKLISDCNEIKALLISSINTAKKSN